jgi:hypothetical protein
LRAGLQKRGVRRLILFEQVRGAHVAQQVSVGRGGAGAALCA